ncbi:exonuclease SbcCD subunit D [Acinetobacter larvae]|uniref:Nuclease SbcCD subunit D n=1 Tax=Acinetobacter larvae TaxID=1789224 RepID=A0A1B2M1Q1_9GAMM|nr:exonuclease SbcCD subunit D [Acinetobacter larvae]AOA59081.1 exonuclease sbcCD subunit D [Acinetobacter larvae]
MSVRFFHTSDWHLGQYFYNHSRYYEHQQFLDWLIVQIEAQQPDALLIAGDIFDVINPAAQAQKQLYQFLADAHRVAPHLQTLMIAGNHDSGYRIEQVQPLLDKYRAKAIGVIQRNAEQALDLDSLLQPIYNREQHIVAWCLALPYLRPAEITSAHEQCRHSQDAIAYLHQQLIAAARQRQQAGQALILMSHAHMQGGESSDSERPIIIGHEEALSISLFDDLIDYVALGHLHKPQIVQQRHIRYSGSPIPLSFSEVKYQHQVLDVSIDPTEKDPEQRLKLTRLAIPRSVPLQRIQGELQEVLQQLQQLPQGEPLPLEQRCYLDIEYHSLRPPQLNLRQQFEDLLPEDRYRLLRIVRKYPQQQSNTESFEQQLLLEAPTPDKLFQQLWQQQGYQADPDVEQDFASLVIEAQQALS